ncbi:MAG TPA: EF-Tu/IF-2/RF-3 family GTPase [Methanomicrobiales archaeon]|nr:EF-Tu/IF-2/RF-3 family GTPase [Methanomicrobiales archaeon]
MGNLNVIMLGDGEYARDLGKKGTASDITFYNLKKGDDTVTFIEPTRYPERFSPLYLAAATAESAIIVVDALTPAFGESVLMLDCLGIREGFLILRNYIPREQVLPLIRGTVVEGYALVEDNPAALRELLLAEAARKQTASPESGGSGSVAVDQVFSVRGIGTVALGSVVQGAIRKHENLAVLPSGKTAQVRSIQKHDDEADVAVEGDRVGIALKNIGVEEVDRGFVLTSDKSLLTVSSATGKAELIKYWNKPLQEGMVLHIGHWMQFIPARVVLVQDEGGRTPLVTLELEKPLVYSPNRRILISHLEGGKLRIVGTMVPSGWVANLQAGQESGVHR